MINLDFSLIFSQISPGTGIFFLSFTYRQFFGAGPFLPFLARKLKALQAHIC